MLDKLIKVAGIFSEALRDAFLFLRFSNFFDDCRYSHRFFFQLNQRNCLERSVRVVTTTI